MRHVALTDGRPPRHHALVAAFRAAVVVTHRVRFGTAVESLESLLSTVPAETQVIYVDAGSPPPIAQELARAAESHDFLPPADRRLPVAE